MPPLRCLPPALLGILLTLTSAVAQLTTYTDLSTFEAAAGTIITEDFSSFTTEDTFHTSAVEAGDFTIFIDASKKSWNFIDIPTYQDSWANIDGTTLMNLFMTRGEKAGFHLRCSRFRIWGRFQGDE